MVCDRTDPVEDFLVEHVMLGLGNIRRALDQIGPGADPVTQSLALRRIEGRINDIEARARALLERRDRAEDGAGIGAGIGAGVGRENGRGNGAGPASPPAPEGSACFTSRRRAH